MRPATNAMALIEMRIMDSGIVNMRNAIGSSSAGHSRWSRVLAAYRTAVMATLGMLGTIAMHADVHAAVNLVWVCPTATIGSTTSSCPSSGWSWRYPGTGQIVDSHTTAGGWGTGTWRRWEDIPANQYVYACSADIPEGTVDGCPSPGVYTHEGYVLKSTYPLPAEASQIKVGSQSANTTPSTANSYYATATTSTRQFWGPDPTTARPVELKELARALRNNVDLIYEYVHDNVRTAFMYGLQKGALGAMIDHSGTSFDQAHLMVELLRESGYTASYKAGTLQLSLAQATAWTGSSNATAIQKIFRDGGIPVDYSGGNFTIGHVWVEVTIPGASCGSTCWFDPSYKAHTFKTPLSDLSTLMGMQATEFDIASGTGFFGSAWTGLQQQATPADPVWISGVNHGNLENKLRDYATALLTNLKTATHKGKEIEDVIGGQEITRVGAAGVRNNATLPGFTTSVQRTWGCPSNNDCGVPDPYRTTLTVKMLDAFTPSHDVRISKKFFVDEIYGRRLSLNTPQTAYAPDTGGPGSLERLCIQLTRDGVPVPATVAEPMVAVGCTTPATVQVPLGRSFIVRLEVDHPYAANSGAYMDMSAASGTHVEKLTDLLTPVSIVHGWGEVSSALLSKLAAEMNHDRLLPVVDPNPGSGGYEPGDRKGDSAMDHTMMKVGMTFLTQYSRMAELQKRLGNAEHVMHHMVGVVYTEVDAMNGWALNPNPPQTDNEWTIRDRAIGINVDGAISVNSKTDVNADRMKVIQSTLAAASALEGSVFEQTLDSPFVASTAHRFRWGSANVAGMRFYLYRPTSPAPSGGFGADFTSTGCTTQQAPSVAQAIPQYASAGFWAITANEKCLGPGNRFGPSDGSAIPNASMQRGPAFMAFKPDQSAVAHVVAISNLSGHTFKGGGAAVSAKYAQEFDAAGVASLLKDKFEDKSQLHGIDLKTGQLTYSAPADLSIGEGGFPYELSLQRTFKPGGTASPGLPVGWAHNLDVRASFSGDAMTKMGMDSAQAAAETIAAIYVSQQIYSVMPTLDAATSATVLRDHLRRWVLGPFVMNWWSSKLNYNVVTINAGHDARQFTRFADGNFYPPRNGVGVLTQTGQRQLHQDTSMPPFYGEPVYDRWDYSPVSFSYTSPQKETQTFGYFETDSPYSPYQAYPENYAGRKHGWHLTNWSFPFGVSVNYNYVATPIAGGSYLDRLSSVTNTVGRALTFGYSGTADLAAVTLSSLTDGQGRTVTYSQPAADWRSRVLTQVTSPESGNGAEITKYDYVGGGLNGAQILPGSRDMLNPKLWKVFAPSDGTYAKMEATYDRAGRVMEFRDAVAVKTPAQRNPWKYFITGSSRGERTDPLHTPSDAHEYTVYYDTRGRAIQIIDEEGRAYSQEFDNRDRVRERTYTEGNKTQFAYDDVTQQVTQITRVPKSSAYYSTAMANIVVSATYDPACGKVKTVTDPNLKLTTWNYNTTTCTLTNIQQPQVPNPQNGNVLTTPTTSYTYNTYGQMMSVTDPTNRVVGFNYDTNNYRWHRYQDPSGLNLTTTYGHNAYGDINSVQDPRLNTTTYTYDKMRRLTQVSASNTTTVNNLDLDGDVWRVRRATNVAATTWQDWTTTFTPTKKVSTLTSPTNAVTTTTYDGLDRVDVVTDAEQRKVKTHYFNDGQTKQIIKAYQSPTMPQIVYATYTLTPNGQIDTIADANDNVTNLDYDGHDRLARTFYPDPASGQPCAPGWPHSATAPTCGANQRYEQLGYDPAGNITSKRNRSGNSISFAFDALNRETTRTVPNNALGRFARTLTSSYDLAGRQFDLTADSQTIAQRYDSAGRLDYVTDSAIGAAYPIDYSYDAASNRTGMTWPGGGSLTYTYDALNRMDTVVDNNGSVVLANYDYDVLSRKDFATYGNSGTPATVDWAYEADDDLNSLVMNGPSALSFTFGRNNVGQITALTASDGAFLSRPASAQTDTYVPNRLNQIATLNGGVLTYDANGNLTADGTFTFEYDEENRLRSAVGGGKTISYEYDPLNRRRAKTVNGVLTRYVSDGDEEIEERDGSNNVLRRYAYGAGIDERIAVLDGAMCAGGRCYYRTNWQGSTTHLINQDGTIRDTYHYGPYGERVGWTPLDAETGNPFRYTGRRYDPETGLYYYRARYYSPLLGRFLQTDPIGTKDDLNLYLYVKNSPLTYRDPSGKVGVPNCPTGTRACQGPRERATAVKTKGKPQQTGTKGHDKASVALRDQMIDEARAAGETVDDASYNRSARAATDGAIDSEKRPDATVNSTAKDGTKVHRLGEAASPGQSVESQIEKWSDAKNNAPEGHRVEVRAMKFTKAGRLIPVVGPVLMLYPFVADSEYGGDDFLADLVGAGEAY